MTGWLAQVAASYKRWRHTRGYGVHSPFAYSVVERVVRRPRNYAFYAYEEIDNSRGADATSCARRNAMTLLRLAAFLDTRSAFMPNDGRSGLFKTALHRANSQMRITSALSSASDCSLVCTSGDYIGLERIISLLSTPGRVVAMHDMPVGWGDTIFESLGQGLALRGKRNAIFFNRPGMQKISYTIRI